MAMQQKNASTKRRNRSTGGWGYLLLGVAAALVLGACMQTSAPTRGGDENGHLAVALATVQASFSDVEVAGGLANPTLMAIAPDGRIFVSEQAGKVRIIKNGVLLATPFLTLSVNSSGERGALGIAFDPAFASNQRVYVYYTSSSGPHNRVSRFTASGDVGGGEVTLLDLPTLSGATNHNGGALHFGTDGKLYIAVGDNANGANAQSLNTTLGKMLRINADGTIPTDNPYYSSTTGINRSIWSRGLRNPYTFAVQPGTGRQFINDVGQNTWEEIDDGVKGANYGWPNTEGYTTDPNFKSPFYAYDHSNGSCAITGGAFYNPSTSTFPSEYSGDYFFADYCGGWIRRIDLITRTVTGFASGIPSPTDIKVDNDGALYYIARGNGSLRKITYTNFQVPVITQQPTSKTIGVGASETLTVAASGAAPLSYQWQRNGVDIAGATGAAYTLNNAQLSDSGAKFRAQVSNPAGAVTSNEATLTVINNQVPLADITTPAGGTLFQGGQVIHFSGNGTDPQDGILPATAFTWEAKLFHQDGSQHSHPFYGPVSGSQSGSFIIPTQGETSSNIWFRIYLTVKDTQGFTSFDSVDIHPRKAIVTLASAPGGLQLKLDGTPVTSPHTFTGVVGIQRSIEAVSPQTSGGKTWQFASWSNGGARVHTISTPELATTLTATFQEVPGQTYQAESAALFGAVIANNHTGYTGTGFVDYLNASGDYIEWTVNAAAAGSKALDFRYALGATTARNMSVTVNGTVVNGNLVFTPTGAWTTWSILTVNANLNAGANKVRATAIGYSGPNVDNLGVR
ncbi:MAG: PQQ-dependent sugar dehydrogenase [Fibrobacterota bacterium]|nr:PQQ-dependent sugar dehydrogenase [Fibrobacterota bacterium]